MDQDQLQNPEDRPYYELGYVSPDQARKLFQNGFNADTDYYFYGSKPRLWPYKKMREHMWVSKFSEIGTAFRAPILADAQSWLRKQGLYAEAELAGFDSEGKPEFSWNVKRAVKFMGQYAVKNTTTDISFESYEAALSAAIDYALIELDK